MLLDSYTKDPDGREVLRLKPRWVWPASFVVSGASLTRRHGWSRLAPNSCAVLPVVEAPDLVAAGQQLASELRAAGIAVSFQSKSTVGKRFVPPGCVRMPENLTTISSQVPPRG